MSISAGTLNRATLERQLLFQRAPWSVLDAVRRLVALQAQHPASPYLALWNRLADFHPADLDAAFASYSIIRSTLLRVTIHAVHTDDYRDFREAMEPSLRGARLGDRRFRVTGLTLDDADALVTDLVEFADKPRSKEACLRWIEERLGESAHPGVWWAMKNYAPLLHVPDAEPWSFDSDRSYISASRPPSLADPEASAVALQKLVRRYLEGFGPASIADIAQFTLIKRSLIRMAIQAMAAELVELAGPSGQTLFDVRGATLPDETTPVPPRLLGMWDNILLAYADRSRIVSPKYRKYVTRINGDVLPTLLVNGYVAGVWRSVEEGIEATAFHPLPEDVWESLALEAKSLLAFLVDRDVDVYRRYDHWWSKDLPAAEVRLLPGRL